MDIDFADNALAEKIMHDNITDAEFACHIISALFTFRLGNACFPKNLSCFHGIFLLPRRPGLYRVIGAPVFVHTAAGLALYLGDRLAGHGHDGMIKKKLALRAMGSDEFLHQFGDFWR